MSDIYVYIVSLCLTLFILYILSPKYEIIYKINKKC